MISQSTTNSPIIDTKLLDFHIDQDHGCISYLNSSKKLFYFDCLVLQYKWLKTIVHRNLLDITLPLLFIILIFQYTYFNTFSNYTPFIYNAIIVIQFAPQHNWTFLFLIHSYCFHDLYLLIILNPNHDVTSGPPKGFLIEYIYPPFMNIFCNLIYLA